jgi:7-carboxy-7-deazaguanine synthase
LVGALKAEGYRVAMETSGTETGQLDAGFEWVCVSTKLNMPGGKVVQPEALAGADEIKHVVGWQRDIDDLEALIAEYPLKPNVQICLQPVSLSRKATQLCIETVPARGWQLSVQTHKYLGAR